MDREEEKEKERASSNKSYLSWNMRGEREKRFHCQWKWGKTSVMKDLEK